MKEQDLNSWSEFEEKLVKLESQRDRLNREGSTSVSPFLFRGQPDAACRLKTTLERYTKKQVIAASDYFRVAIQVRPQIETYTGKRWEVDSGQIEKWIKKPNLLFPKSFPAQEYMIYLRHHGFPSPLLDWTRSPFVAAYFAFNKIPDEVEKVAIFAYLEWAGQGKTQDGDNPVISSLPVNVPSHKRHFVQQSEYTVCAAETQSGVVFASHENAFSITEKGENLLWKFTLPSSERIAVLNKMDQMNINSLSLFDNEEGLMETVALRGFYLSNEDL